MVIENVSLVNSSCTSANACLGLGRCYSASMSVHRQCAEEASSDVGQYFPNPMFVWTSCESLGFRWEDLRPDACYDGRVARYSNGNGTAHTSQVEENTTQANETVRTQKRTAPTKDRSAQTRERSPPRVSLVDSKCRRAAQCTGLGGCVSATQRFFDECLAGPSQAVNQLMPHPIILHTSCESLGFKPMTKTSTSCFGESIHFFSTDETLWSNMFRLELFEPAWCLERRKAAPQCFNSVTI